MLKTLFCTSLVALLLTFGSLSPVRADTWQLDPEQSNLNFVSVKNDFTAETHTFNQLNGELKGEKLRISIPVASLDTSIAIRNERMLEHLFSANEFATVSATADVPATIYRAASATVSVPAVIPLTVTIAGQTAQLDANVQITRLSTDRLRATTTQPLLINSRQFQLAEGINKLREIAGLERIDYVIPVTFSVQFDRVH
ncbi:hypothetical protein PSI9734_00743 [Pseudidiomarina piscicola]|uniref:Lipid/polyisoprenoid-binding YceI-like domain-containing protein n=1 Tax=Pseudidiomarina piscicola TaxID=2614830 RepID=A0A6S6WLR1_9GAMM|nr:YceI family protein [Pseudidiomarina piscicola]CAB0150177.1 hypothetical protein PSI9734_00743 [Pseudidiomarina piscicola]VZT39615.1 hypothetical protein PSI9734_00743 [Pseudomonas aeruginosa]